MGNKIKPRRIASEQERGRKVRNWVAQDANESGRFKGGPMQDRREKRAKNVGGYRNRGREIDDFED